MVTLETIQINKRELINTCEYNFSLSANVSLRVSQMDGFFPKTMQCYLHCYIMFTQIVVLIYEYYINSKIKIF